VRLATHVFSIGVGVLTASVVIAIQGDTRYATASALVGALLILAGMLIYANFKDQEELRKKEDN